MSFDSIKQDIRQSIQANKIIVILRRVPSDRILTLADALYKAGIRLIETTFDQSSSTALSDTAQAIKALKSKYGETMRIGAGTVLNVRQLFCAAEAGAEFILSPNVNEVVIQATKDAGLVSIPGAFTPTEVERAYACGADYVKLFPSSSMGVPYIKSLKGPLGHIPLIAVGGIDETNVADFINAGVSAVGIGSNIVKEAWVQENNFDAITILAKKYTDAIGVM